MNIALSLVMLFSFALSGSLTANNDKAQIVTTREYYSTKALGEEKCTQALELITQLRKFGDIKYDNYQDYVSIMQELEKLEVDARVVETILKNDVIITTTEDDGLFLVIRKYDTTLEEYYIKNGPVLGLPIKSDEVSGVFEALKFCYEQKSLLKIEQDKLETSRKRRQELEHIHQKLVEGNAKRNKKNHSLWGLLSNAFNFWIEALSEE